MILNMINSSDIRATQAYEQLVSLRVFVPIGQVSIGTKAEFVRHRCAVERVEVKRVVEQIGQLNLKKWFSKS